jgi:hypothetical protein
VQAAGVLELRIRRNLPRSVTPSNFRTLVQHLPFLLDRRLWLFWQDELGL